jgi:hypothetical protein
VYTLPHMTYNAIVARTGTKTSARVVSEFTRKIQSVGIVKGLRNKRYRARANSKRATRVHKLNKLTKGAEIHKLIKEGKMVARAPRTSFKPRTQAPEAAPAAAPVAEVAA